MSGTYRTIVADPPWDHSDGTGWYFGDDHAHQSGSTGEQRKTRPAYAYMTVAEIAALPIASLAAHDATLFLWATRRYLRDAYTIAEAWGFKPVHPIVWAKPPMSPFMGGSFPSAAEYVLYAKRGRPKHHGRGRADWFAAPRSGGHSAKPEAFIDMVEQVSPGPYLEIFARRARFGWDYAGDGSLGTVEIPGLRAPGDEREAA